jgi:hypothetical protein
MNQSLVKIKVRIRCMSARNIAEGQLRFIPLAALSPLPWWLNIEGLSFKIFDNL